MTLRDVTNENFVACFSLFFFSLTLVVYIYIHSRVGWRGGVEASVS